MGSDITYLFVAEGQDSVASAFEGIGASAEKSSSRASGSYAKTARAAKDTGRAQKAEADKAAAAQKKADDAAWKSAEKKAAQIVRAAEREAAAVERAEARKAKAAAASAEKQLASLLKVGKGTKYAIGLAVAGAAAATALIGKAVGASMSAQGQANRISINGRAPGRTSVDPTLLRREMEATAIAHAGQTSEGVAGGISAFQEARGGDRGNALDEARKFSDVIATVASATGKGTDEIGKAAALLAKDHGVKTVDEMGNALAKLVSRARDSGQPLDEVVSHLDKMGALAKRVGLTGATGALQMGALQTLGAEGAGAGKGDQAVEAFFKKITSDKTARTLKAAGADPYADKNGHLKDPRAMLEGLYKNIGSKASASDKISTIGKTVGPQGAKMLYPLNKAYATGYEGAKGSDDDKVKAGVDAMLAAFDRVAESTGSYAEIQRDAAQAESSSGSKLEQAWQKIVAVVGEELAPKIADLATKFASSEGAFTLLVAAVGAAADALSALEYALERLKIIDGKTEYQKGEAAKTKSLAYQKQLDAMGGEAGYNKLSPEDRARYNIINTKKLTEDQKVVDAKWGMSDSQQHTIDAMGKAPPPPPPVGAPAKTGMPAYATDTASTGQQQPFVMQGVDASAAKLATSADALKAAADALKQSGGTIYGNHRNPVNGA